MLFGMHQPVLSGPRGRGVHQVAERRPWMGGGPAHAPFSRRKDCLQASIAKPASPIFHFFHRIARIRAAIVCNPFAGHGLRFVPGVYQIGRAVSAAWGQAEFVLDSAAVMPEPRRLTAVTVRNLSGSGGRSM